MALKLQVGDPRLNYKEAQIRGKKYTYILSEPKDGKPRDTVVLIHGWPDLAFGWRYQIPYLTDKGFRVVVPNMLGYGQTDAPRDVKEYTLKSISEDIKELARIFVGDDGQIILGGHDWGGAVVWRVTLWFPGLIKGVFSICSPFAPPTDYEPLRTLEGVIKYVPNFRYQLQLAGQEAEQKLQGRDRLHQVFRTVLGGRTLEGELGFDVGLGFKFDVMPNVGRPRSSSIDDEDLDYYVEQYSLRSPEFRGPLNWYRTRELNFDEEKESDLLMRRRSVGEDGVWITAPALMVTASNDEALPASMSANMGLHFRGLKTGHVEGDHWILVKAADKVNGIIGDWIEEVSGGLELRKDRAGSVVKSVL